MHVQYMYYQSTVSTDEPFSQEHRTLNHNTCKSNSYSKLKLGTQRDNVPFFLHYLSPDII